MDDNAAKKSDGLRELILDGISYIDIDLPNSGKVRMHPYISAGAIGAYESHADDPKAAFEALFEESREVKDTPAPALTDDDADMIARLYADKEGFLDRYTAARATKLPSDAFAQAIKESDFGRSALRAADSSKR
jgi:hypothetical protein